MKNIKISSATTTRSLLDFSHLIVYRTQFDFSLRDEIAGWRRRDRIDKIVPTGNATSAFVLGASSTTLCTLRDFESNAGMKTRGLLIQSTGAKARSRWCFVEVKSNRGLSGGLACRSNAIDVENPELSRPRGVVFRFYNGLSWLCGSLEVRSMLLLTWSELARVGASWSEL